MRGSAAAIGGTDKNMTKPDSNGEPSFANRIEPDHRHSGTIDSCLRSIAWQSDSVARTQCAVAAGVAS